MADRIELRDTFETDLAEVSWKELRIHLKRDAIILVTDDLNLVDVAVDIAADNKTQVALWISSGKLTKPSSEQIEQWTAMLDTPFRMLIAQPYILVQAVNHA
ncbi:MAG TPA: DUF2288 domain-containing protein [Geopsychrobacteraceae bacterium]|nr:DUF2288 domain-containing protein [Geopsychrobacteraceae bacterium]